MFEVYYIKIISNLFHGGTHIIAELLRTDFFKRQSHHKIFTKDWYFMYSTCIPKAVCTDSTMDPIL